jgi:hypothetical protein
MTVVAGRPEQRASLSSAWPFSKPVIRQAQPLTVLLATALTPHTACEYSLVIPSLPQEIKNQPVF